MLVSKNGVKPENFFKKLDLLSFEVKINVGIHKLSSSFTNCVSSPTGTTFALMQPAAKTAKQIL